MTSLFFNQDVIVTPPPGGGAPYAARFAHRSSRQGFVYVRGPGGLHAVPEGTVTPMVLGLGDAKAALHAGGRT